MGWKSIVKSIAPVLGTAIAGPFGAMATKAIAGAVLGKDADANLTDRELGSQLEKVLANDKEALLRLKQADQDFDKEMKQLDVDIMKIDAEDRASARGLAQNTSLVPQMILSTIYVIAFATILIFVFTGKVELIGKQADIANVLLGILSAGLLQIMNFFFGSSSGSKEKTAKLAKANG